MRPRTSASFSPSAGCWFQATTCSGASRCSSTTATRPDPVGEFLSSLDVVERLDARLCLAGHGRTFTDVHAHIDGNRELVADRLQKIIAALAQGEPLTAFGSSRACTRASRSRAARRGCCRKRSRC